LTYELEALRSQIAKKERRADSALSKCERMEREHDALVAERDAALAKAEAVAEEFRQFKTNNSNKELQEQCDQKDGEIRSLRGQLADVTQERDELAAKLQEATGMMAAAPKKAVPKSNQETSEADLMEAFDSVDEDETGFAPRLDLRKKVDEFIPKDPYVQVLSDTIRGLDVMILEKDDYIDHVHAWMEGRNKQAAPPPARKATQPEPQAPPKKPQAGNGKQQRLKVEKFLLDAFDKVDEDGTEFAPRLDLRKQVDKYVDQCPDAQQLSDYIRALDVMIVEKDDYNEMVNNWIEGKLE